MHVILPLIPMAIDSIWQWANEPQSPICSWDQLPLAIVMAPFSIFLELTLMKEEAGNDIRV